MCTTKRRHRPLPFASLAATSLLSLLAACGEIDPGPGQLGAGEPGKGDWWPGNKEADAQCDYDWQCRQDLGHVCRPEVVCVRTIHWAEAIGGGTTPMEERVGFCGPPHPDGQRCDEPDDCGSKVCEPSTAMPSGAHTMRCGNPYAAANPPSQKCVTQLRTCTLPVAVTVGSPCSCEDGFAPGTVVATWYRQDLSNGVSCEGLEGWLCNGRIDCTKPSYF
jgi:hypothetical protein